MLVVTHEMDFARHVANRVVFMDAGVIVEQADAETFFTNPRAAPHPGVPAELQTKEFYLMNRKKITDPGPDRRYFRRRAGWLRQLCRFFRCPGC